MRRKWNDRDVRESEAYKEETAAPGISSLTCANMCRQTLLASQTRVHPRTPSPSRRVPPRPTTMSAYPVLLTQPHPHRHSRQIHLPLVRHVSRIRVQHLRPSLRLAMSLSSCPTHPRRKSTSLALLKAVAALLLLDFTTSGVLFRGPSYGMTTCRQQSVDFTSWQRLE